MVLKIQISKKYLVNYSLLTIQVAILSIIVILDIFFKSKELYIVFNIIFLIIAYEGHDKRIISIEKLKIIPPTCSDLK